jgi:hypothetical protein
MLLGLIAPFLGVMLFYYVKFFPLFSFMEYCRAMMINKSQLTAVSTISLMANVILFYLYTNRRSDKTAMGIFAITCLYIVTVLLFKLFY